jgi:AraC-like DNA-binding protein
MMYFDMIRLSAEHYGRITFSGVKGTADGIACYKTQGKFFTMVVREIKGDEFTIHEVSLNTRQTLMLSTSSRQGVSLAIPLQNSLHYMIEGLEEATLGNQHYNLFFNPQAQGLYKFYKGKYIIFAVHFDVDFLWRWRGVHKKLSAFMENVRYRKHTLLNRQPCQATGEMMFVASDLFLREKPLPEMYRYAKVMDLLRAAIWQSALPVIKIQKIDLINDRDKFKLNQVAEYVKQHIVNPASIDELSRRFDINEFKLKSGFKALYGTTIFEYLNVERMEKAKALLRDIDNFQVTVQQVSELVGFKNVSNFSSAYKRYYGYTPRTSRDKIYPVDPLDTK